MKNLIKALALIVILTGCSGQYEKDQLKKQIDDEDRFLVLFIRLYDESLAEAKSCSTRLGKEYKEISPKREIPPRVLSNIFKSDVTLMKDEIARQKVVMDIISTELNDTRIARLGCLLR